MSKSYSGQWLQMASAPTDGSKVLVSVRASEQGPAEIDVARWAKPDPASEECWIAADSNPNCVIIYADAELIGWMPLPATLPQLRSARNGAERLKSAGAANKEMAGSGI